MEQSEKQDQKTSVSSSGSTQKSSGAKPSTGKEHLVQKDVLVRRGGKVFKQRRWVRDGSVKSLTKTPSKEHAEELTKGDHTVHDKVIAALKKRQQQLEELLLGKEKKISGVPTTKLADGAYGFRSSGQRLVAVGSNSGAVVLDYLARAGGDIGEAATGDLRGGTTRQAQAEIKQKAVWAAEKIQAAHAKASSKEQTSAAGKRAGQKKS